MRYLTLIILCLTCCTKPSQEWTTTSDSTPQPTPQANTPPLSDTAIFVGLAGRLNETNEFYITAHHFDNNTEFNHDYADSVVYENEDEGVKRRRVPMEMVKKYFHIEGLERVRLYNERHNHLGTYKLKRVEMIEDPLFTEFGLVYDAPASVKNAGVGFFYVIPDGAQHHIVKQFESDLLTQEDALYATENILKQLKLDTTLNWTAYHRIVRPSEVTYSTLSFAQQSYLIETRGGTSTIVGEYTDGYHFGDFLPAPLLVNDRPVLLMTWGNPEGDDRGDHAMAFDGKEFKGVAYGRVRVGGLD